MVKLYVNGRHKFIGFEKLSYEQIVIIANEDRQVPVDDLHTITYRYRKHDLMPGELTPGESIQVRDDMVINAMVTGNA